MPNCSTLLINTACLENNYHTLKNALPSNGKIIGMVKANGYGMGSIALAKTYLKIGMSTLGVSHLSEARILRENGIIAPILVLSTSISDLNEAIDLGVELSIFTIQQAEELNALAEKRKKNVSVHIKVDTGLSRFGFLSSEIPFLNQRLKNWKNLKLKGIMTHLMGADLSKFDSFSLAQVQDFEKAMLSLSKLPEEIHFASSSSIHRFSHPLANTARVGLALLGYNNSPTPLALSPALTLKSQILTIKSWETKTGIGYHHTYTIEKNERLGIVPIGYHDGIPFCLSDKAYFLVNGQKAYIKGRIYMDFTSIDLTNISAKVGDEVIIFDQNHDPLFLAEWGNISIRTLLSTLSPRIERIYQ